MGDIDRTRAELAIVAERPSVENRLLVWKPVLEAYALAGSDDERRGARDVLAISETPHLYGGHLSFSYEGSVSRLLGLLDASLGDLENAERELREAYDFAVERKHAPWQAQIAHELAKVLSSRGREGEAKRLIEESTTIARQLGMTGLVEAIEQSGTAVAAIPNTAATAGTISMTVEGDTWKIERGSAIARVRDSRGMRLLARLVDRPGEEIHVLGLASDDATSAEESTAGEMLDDRARKAYRNRLAELDDDLAEAERHGDARRAAKLEKEKEALHGELARAVGLGGRTRHAASSTERARVNIQRRVKDAIGRIGQADESLGRFLEGAVSTGTFCCFRP
jgi:hypothetical protein